MAVPAEQQKLDLREPAGWRRTSNRIATALMMLAFVLVMIPLGFVIYTVIAKGASAIKWSFLTSSIPPQVAPPGQGGIGPAVVGTLEPARLVLLCSGFLVLISALRVRLVPTKTHEPLTDPQPEGA